MGRARGEEGEREQVGKEEAEEEDWAVEGSKEKDGTSGTD